MKGNKIAIELTTLNKISTINGTFEMIKEENHTAEHFVLLGHLRLSDHFLEKIKNSKDEDLTDTVLNQYKPSKFKQKNIIKTEYFFNGLVRIFIEKKPNEIIKFY